MITDKLNTIGSQGLKTIFRSLKYRNYRLFFSGQGISLIGTWMQRIAMPWLVYKLTGSVLLLGVVSFVGQLPTMVLAPIAGVLTDRMNRYHVMIGTQVLSMVQAGILTLLVYSGTIEIWHIILLSGILGCVNAFDVPARQSFVIELVEKKDDLGNAIALNSLMFNGARIIGPSVAGILLASVGEGMCFLLNSISYLFVIASLLFMKVKPFSPAKNNSRIFQDLKEGLQYTFGFPPLKHVILLLAVVNLMGMPFSVLMPVFAKEVLHGDSNTYGFLMGAAGLGALVGAIYMASRKEVIKLGRIIPVSTFIFGVGLILFSFSRIFYVSFFLMVITGLGMMLQTASSNTVLQTITDDDKRGRVMGFYTMAIMGTAPFSSLIAGGMAKIIGPSYTIFVGAICCIFGAVIFSRKLPELKRLARPVYVKRGIIPEVATGIQTAMEREI